MALYPLITFILVTGLWIGLAFAGIAFSRKKTDPQLWQTCIIMTCVCGFI